MEGLAAAASVTAIIDISAKVASLCFQYSIAAMKAREDIQRLQKKIGSIGNVLKELQQQLGRPDGTRLSTTQKLSGSLQECLVLVQKLETQLEPGKTRKAMSRFGGCALKWPFQCKEIEKIVASLEDYEQTFSLSLQIDQRGIILDLDQKIDLAKLPVAGGASFNSHAEEHNRKCLVNTRVEIQRQIMDWAKSKDGKDLFWLSGMAGTGKSTIARTVAQSFTEQGRLGASFFFKKGEGDRGNASRFITSVAVDLMTHIPRLKPEIRKAVDLDPAIAQKALQEQFEKLILQPLSEIQGTTFQDKELVIVIDALDECDREEDTRTILRLLARAREIKPSSLRIFVTSRPEFFIRLGFKQMPDGAYQDLILHEVAKESIARDIRLFFESELAEIREQRSLDQSWPGEQDIQTLVGMAVPLFIVAATLCRFLGEINGNPRRRLVDILQYDTEDIPKQDVTYLPILNHLFAGQTERQKEKLSQGFREVVGSIIMLEDPLSVTSIAHLLDISREDVSCRLDSLHSVLSVPCDESGHVRPLHLSFRDFLLDPGKSETFPFYVDEQEAHARLTGKCLQLMSSPRGLKQNLVDLPSPGTLRNEVDSETVNRKFPSELQYACRYWVNHLQRSKRKTFDNEQVHKYLQKHTLHWLEAMSLMGEVAEAINMIGRLQLCVDQSQCTELWALILDLKRFALWNRQLLETAPLQLYSSALVFAPEESIIRNSFDCKVKSCRVPKRDKGDWGAVLQTLDGHTHSVLSIAFASNRRYFASGSWDKTIKLWDAATGSLQQTLEGHLDGILSVTFSPDDTQLASVSSDGTTKLWDMSTGCLQQTLEGHLGEVACVAFSWKSRQLASGFEDSTIKLWDTATGSLQQTLKGHSDVVRSVAFSRNSTQLASGSEDRTIKLWDTTTGILQQTLEDHSDAIRSVAFSSNGRQLASGSEDRDIKLWNVTIDSLSQTRKYSLQQTFKGHKGAIVSVAFSSDGTQLASSSLFGEILLWSAVTGKLQQTCEDHNNYAHSIAFSPDGTQLAAGCVNRAIKLFDTTTRSLRQPLDANSKVKDLLPVEAVALSPDGMQLAFSCAWKIQLWDMATVSLQATFEDERGMLENKVVTSDLGAQIGPSDSAAESFRTITPCSNHTGTGSSFEIGPFHSNVRMASSLVFSPDGTQLAKGYRCGCILLWCTTTKTLQRILRGHTDTVKFITFSPNGMQLASASEDREITLWDTATWSLQWTVNKSHLKFSIASIAFSPDGMRLASNFGGIIKLWDTATGNLQRTLEQQSNIGLSIAFSPDGTHLETTAGLLNLQDEEKSPLPYPKNTKRIWCGPRWIARGTERLLWFPHEYRLSCSDVKDNKVAIVHRFGQIRFLDFDLSED